jgi:hypothetical protein
MAVNPITSGLIVQLDSRQHTASDGDLVSSWADLSGNGNNAASTLTKRPTYKTNIINGKPVIRFANKGMLGGLTGWSSPTGMQICCLVTNFTASAGFAGLGSLAPSGGSDNGNTSSIIMGGTTGSANFWGGFSTAGSFYSNKVIGNSSLSFLSYGVSATENMLGVDTTPIRANLTSTIGTAQGAYSVGCRLLSGVADNAYAVTADYCLFLVYSRLLTNSEFASLGAWALSEFAASGGTAKPSLPFSQQVIG